MKKIIFLLVITLSFMACTNENSETQRTDFSDLLWHKTDKPNFEFNIKKEANYSIAIELRLVYGYAYRNIKMNMNLSKDGAKSELIPIDFMVRNEDDSYKGTVMGDFIDITEVIIAKRSLQAGKYKFELDQIMNEETLPFVMEVGVILTEIESTTK